MLFAQDTKSIRGQIVDKDSKYPIIGANIVLIGSNPFIGAASDENGYFSLNGVPLGRASIKISYIGYNDVTLSEILVMAGKEN